MTSYLQQIHCPSAQIDLAFWKSPRGVAVPDDELRFLLVPDAVEAQAVRELSQQVHHYQREQAATQPLTRALIATMGGMLPGILLYDHLVYGRPAGTPEIAFGTIGISLYKGPDERHEQPQVHQEASVTVAGERVLLIDDLVDRGITMAFLQDYISGRGAKGVMRLALYMKPAARKVCPADFFFGEVAQDTWIITPRELVETMVKRVPLWKKRGANEQECYRRLVDIIGYPVSTVEQYLPALFRQD